MSALSITLWALLEAFISIFIGAYTCRSIPFALTTLRDFGFLTVNVLLPCLALYNVAKAATPVMLLRMLVLICFAVIQIALNYGCGWIVARVLFRTNGNDDGLPAELRKDVRLELLYDHTTTTTTSTNTSMNDADAALGERVATPYVALVLHDRLRGLDLTPRELLAAIEVPSAASERLPGYVWGCVIACSVQNTLSLPLALLENLLPMLPWVDFGAGVSYAFLFHVICLIYLSGCAPYLVQRAERACRRRRLIRLILQRTKHLSSCVDATTQTKQKGKSYMRIEGETQNSIECAKEEEDGTSLSEASADNNKDTSSTKDVDVTRMPHDWPAAGRVRVVFESDFAALRPHATSQWRRFVLRPTRRMLRQLATYLPFLAIVLGLVIGIVPFIRGLFFDEGVLEMFTDAISLVAQGGIPSTLLLLGANLGGPATFSTLSTTTTSQDGIVTTNAGAAKQQSAEQNVNFSITAEHVYLSSDDDEDDDNTTTAEGAASNAGRQGERNVPVTAVTSGAVNGVHSTPQDNAALASGQRAMSVDSSSLSESHTELETELQRNTTTTAQRVTQHDEATQSHNPSFFPSTQRPTSSLSNSNTRVGRENNSDDDEEREVPEIDLHASFTLQTLVAERPSGAEAVATTITTNSAAASPTVPSTLPLPSQQQQQQDKEVIVQQPAGSILASADTRREGEAAKTTSVTNATATTITTPPPPTTSTTNNAALRPEGTDTTTTTIVPVEVEETIASMATLRAMLSLKHVQPRFVLGVSVGRLLLCPGVTLLILWLCVKAMPWLFGGAGSMDRTFVLVLILEIMAPTAVNTALLFRSQSFMVREWAEMLFVQNLLALLSIVLWCSVALSLLHTTSNAVPE